VFGLCRKYIQSRLSNRTSPIVYWTSWPKCGNWNSKLDSVVEEDG